MSTRKALKLLLLMAFLFVSGCNPLKQTAMPSPTTIVHRMPTASFTPSWSPTASAYNSPTSQSTPTLVFPTFYDLPAGEYVLYQQHDGLYAVSPNGNFQTKYTSLSGFILSSDASLFMSGSVIYDTYTHAVLNTALNDSFSDCYIWSASPDREYFALQCGNRGLYVISRQNNNEWVKISLDDPDNRGFDDPLWSPDGKWISYIRSVPDPTGASISGLHQLFLVDTSCMADLSTCPLNERGPISGDFFIGNAPYGWSPDSKRIAIPADSQTSILIYDLQTGLIRHTSFGKVIYSVSWSPDEKWFAFDCLDSNSIDRQTCVGPVGGGEAIQLTSGHDDKYLVSWINVP